MAERGTLHKFASWHQQALPSRASLHGCREDLGIAVVAIHSSSGEVFMGTDIERQDSWVLE